MAEFDLAWFMTTPFGEAYVGLQQDLYDLALTVSEAELADVWCYCPTQYPVALQIKLSLVLSQITAATAPGSSPASTPASRTAYVVADKVMDTERRYELVAPDKSTLDNSPSGILQGIIARCKAPLRIGATLARSFVSSGGSCGCGPDPELMGKDGADKVCT